MQIYIIYSFHEPGIEEKIRELTSKIENRQIISFYFDVTRKVSWKFNAYREMKKSDLVVFFLSKQYFVSDKNINWELKCAEKLDKTVYYIPVDITDEEIFEKNETRKLLMDSKGTTIDGFVEKIHDNYEYNLSSLLFPDNVDKTFTDDDRYILMDQYRTMMESSENLMNRRQATSSFFVSICTAMVGIFGVLGAIGLDPIMLAMLMIGVCSCGILMCMSWKASLNSYDRINYSKYNVMECMEAALPASMFFAEYRDTKNPLKGNVYQSYSKREHIIPNIFAVLFGIIIMIAVVMLIVLG